VDDLKSTKWHLLAFVSLGLGVAPHFFLYPCIWEQFGSLHRRARIIPSPPGEHHVRQSHVFGEDLFLFFVSKTLRIVASEVVFHWNQRHC
jgi:hypothetical protein